MCSTSTGLAKEREITSKKSSRDKTWEVVRNEDHLSLEPALPAPGRERKKPQAWNLLPDQLKGARQTQLFRRARLPDHTQYRKLSLFSRGRRQCRNYLGVTTVTSKSWMTCFLKAKARRNGTSSLDLATTPIQGIRLSAAGSPCGYV